MSEFLSPTDDAWLEDLLDSKFDTKEVPIQSTNLLKIPTGMFKNKSGLIQPNEVIAKKLEKNFSKYTIPLEPTFCNSYSAEIINAIYDVFDDHQIDTYSFPKSPCVITELDGDRTLYYTIWSEDLKSESANSTGKSKLYRFTATDHNYLLTVDAYEHTEGKLNNYVMLQRFLAEDKRYVDALLFMNLTKTSEDWNNVHLYTDNPSNCPELTHINGLSAIHKQLLPRFDPGLPDLDTFY